MSLEKRKFFIENCDRCSHCKWVPEVKSEKFSNSCPSIFYGNFHTYSAGGKGALAYGLIEKRIDYSEEMLHNIYACTMCGACDVGCKWHHAGLVEPLDTLYALRQRLADDGRALPAHNALIANLRTHGNPQGLPAGDRFQWAEGMGLPEIGRGARGVWLHIGCENSYDEAAWPELRVVAGLLQRAGVKFGISRQERNAGGLAFDLGFVADAKAMAEAARDIVRASGIRKIITCSASSYAAFRNIYPRLGISLDGIEIVHAIDAIEQLIASNAVTLPAFGHGKVTYHDPCKLGRLSEPYTPWDGEWTLAFNEVVISKPPRPVLFGARGDYEAPRSLLRRIAGFEIVEMERSKNFAFCCEAGAGAKAASPEFAEKAALHRLDEARATGATTLVSSCTTCTGHLREVAVRNSAAIEVRGLFELLAETLSMGA